MTRRPRKKIVKTYSFELPCESKRQFKTEKEARAAAEFHMLENMNIELDVYQCTICHQWHMTTKKPERRAGR